MRAGLLYATCAATLLLPPMIDADIATPPFAGADISRERVAAYCAIWRAAMQRGARGIKTYYSAREARVQRSSFRSFIAAAAR